MILTIPMEKRRKRKHSVLAAVILAAMILSICTGCNADKAKTDTQSTSAEIGTTEPQSETKINTSISINTNTEPQKTPAGQEEQEHLMWQTATEETAQQELSDSFKIIYKEQEAKIAIELAHCDQVYDADGFRIYARYVYWTMVPESFPSEQYVLYIQTPKEAVQLYPIADFLVDKEQKTLYTKIAGDDGFECVQCIFFTQENGLSQDAQKELLSAKQAQKMLRDAHDGGEEKTLDNLALDFSNITVELTEAKTGENGTGILCGETGGIEKASGQRYYTDWEIDISSGGLNVINITSCILEQYDSNRDREIFAESSRLFDQIEQGDWSCVKPIEGMEYLWGAGDGEWFRIDVNGDGLPELVNGWEMTGLGYDTSVRKINITFIFTYQNQTVELVYVDVNDGMEFLYIAGNGNLVYEWCVSGGPCTNLQRLCRFDLKWNKEYLDTLVLYRFPEDDGIDSEYYRENFPDTFGVGGYGTYYLRERKKTREELADNTDGKYTVREYLTEEQFLNAYEEMTGWDFYASQYMY